MTFYDIYNQTKQNFKDINPIEKYDINDIKAVNELCEICDFTSVNEPTAFFTYKNFGVYIDITPTGLTALNVHLYAFKNILQNEKKFKLLTLFDTNNLIHYDLLGCILNLTEEEINKIFEIISISDYTIYNEKNSYAEAVFEYKNSEIIFHINLLDLDDCFEFYNIIKQSVNNFVLFKRLAVK